MTSLSRLTSAENPENGTTSYTYRDNGNLYTKTDAGSVVVTSTWDQLNRITGKSYSGGVATPTVTYCYDGDTSGACAGAPSGNAGDLTMVSNSNSVTKYTSYDLLRRVTGSSQKIGSDTALAFSYTYNKASGLETETYPSGRQVKTCYDQAGRPKSVQNVSTAAYYANSITYAPHGAVSSLPLGNGMTETWSYLRMQPASIEATKSGSLWKLENFYCANQQSSCASNNGNVISQRLTAPKTAGGTLVLTQAYGYDNMNRISAAAESGSGTTWSQSYGFGPDNGRFGNLVVSGDQPAPSLACGSYSSSTNRCTSAGFQYDDGSANGPGNLTTYQSRTLTYDAENRQKTLTDSGTTYTYTYDGDGRRVKKEGGGTTVKYVYDALGRLAAEYSTAAASSPCATCYLTADHLGSTRMMTNQSGTPVRRYDYFPFGQEIASGYGSRTTVTGYTTDTLNPKFTGKPRDYESGLGLDFFGARYFAGAQARFTSVDPVFATASLPHPQSWNGYAYTLNNPLKYVDQRGEFPINVITAGVGTAIGGLVGAAGEYANQVRTSGHITSGARIWTAAGGGALAGGIAGFTLGVGAGAGLAAGAVETGVITASSTVIGDFAQHRMNDALGVTNPGENSTELSGTLVNAATAGIGGLVGGAVADRLLPIPNIRKEVQLLLVANRRSTRAARIQAASARAQSVAVSNGAIGNTLGSAIQQTSDYLWSLIVGAQRQQLRKQPTPEKKDYATDITIRYILP